jgi:thiol-disulfide isomerase/thioredoxin
MIPHPKDSYLPTEVAPGEWLFEMPLMGPTMARLTMSSMTGIMDIMLEPGADNTVWVDQAAWANQVAPGDPKETWAWFDGRYAAFNMVYVNEFMPYNNDSPVKQYDVSSNVPMLRGMVGKPKEELFPMMKAKRDEILATVDTLSSFSATAREVLKYQIAAGYIGEIGQLGFSIAYQQIMDDESLERSNEKLRELMPVFTPEDYRVAYEGVDFNDPYLFYGMWYYRAYNGLDSQVREAAGMDGTRIGNYVTIAEKIGLDGQAPTIDPADPTAEKRKTEWDKFMQPVNERFAAITDPFFTEALALREQWTAKLREAAANAVGVVVNEAPAELDPFEKIIAKYKGKPVLVDLWATWCGPCLNAMKQQRALKEELMEEGVVFVYITGVTSPKGTWETMIPDIKGEHYYLTGEQWSELDRKFDVDGIPFYIMVQRDGSWKADTNMRLLNVWESTIRAAIDKK